MGKKKREADEFCIARYTAIATGTDSLLGCTELTAESSGTCGASMSEEDGPRDMKNAGHETCINSSGIQQRPQLFLPTHSTRS